MYGEMRCPVCCFGCCNEEIAFECKCVNEGGEWSKVLVDVLLPEGEGSWSVCGPVVQKLRMANGVA